MIIGIVGAGAMGGGIAQLAAMAGHEVRLFDKNDNAKVKALTNIEESISKFISRGTLTPEEGKAVTGNIYLCDKLSTLSDCDLIIEAIIEDLDVKKELFKSLENIVSPECILASNTSSLSITSIAATLSHSERCIGIHFFNPPVLMKLVEVIPAIQTNPSLIDNVKKIIESWGKTVVIAKDTPGFIVNKVARPFYSEAIRILEEGIADMETIDYAMTSHGFKMGPFTLMDFIGHDVNFKVTESVWKSFFYDSRYQPSLTQQRLLEAGFLGKKSGRGFYNYAKPSDVLPSEDKQFVDNVFNRILCMMINEAADTVGRNICSAEDVDTAVKLGVNYPKGLLEWGREIGYNHVKETLNHLFDMYHEERYRASVYLTQNQH